MKEQIKGFRHYQSNRIIMEGQSFNLILKSDFMSNVINTSPDYIDEVWLLGYALMNRKNNTTRQSQNKTKSLVLFDRQGT